MVQCSEVKYSAVQCGEVWCRTLHVYYIIPYTMHYTMPLLLVDYSSVLERLSVGICLSFYVCLFIFVFIWLLSTCPVYRSLYRGRCMQDGEKNKADVSIHPPWVLRQDIVHTLSLYACAVTHRH